MGDAAPAPTPAPGSAPGSARGAITTAILLTLIALGLAYYAYTLWQLQQRTETDLKGARAEVSQLTVQERKQSDAVTQLKTESVSQKAELATRQDELKTLSARLAATEQELEALNEKHSEVEERLAEFKRFTESFQRMIDSGQLEVSFRRGRMIVELPAQVLFPSGSAELTEQGTESLKEVAQVLRKIRGKRFIVAGHTDNVPVSSETFPSNWDLSASRAVNVTRSLIGAGLSPRRLVAAGYSEYDPVGNNKSKQGRKRNRRIEIILEPHLQDVPELDD